MENSLADYQQKAKGLFEQKGGTLGMVILALGVVVLVWNIKAIAAFATTLLGLLVTVGVIALILFLVFNKDFRMLVGTCYMMAIRWIMGKVIKMNPIAILEDTIKEMYKRIDDVEDKMGKLNGVRLKFKDKIKAKKKDLQDCLDRKAAADRTGNKSVSILEGRQSQRLIDITKEYMDLQVAAENWYSTLSKIAEQAKLVAEDADNEVKIQKEKYDLVKESHSAFKSAMSILKGSPDELARYNQAFDFVSKDIMDKVGEMDRVINTTGGLIDKMDIDKEMYAIKGDDISKKYAELGIDALFEKMQALPSTQMNLLQVSNLTTETPVLEKSKSKYFNN